jgi:ribonuclease HI
LEEWTRPPKDFVKLNFDGSSKGNPSPFRMGGVLRDDKGNILRVFFGLLGQYTNNGVEISSLERGLQISKTQGYDKLMVEGDSKI